MALYTIKPIEAECPICGGKAELRIDYNGKKQRVYVGCQAPEEECGWVSKEVK